MDIIIGINPANVQTSTDGPAFKVGTMGSASDPVTGAVRDYMYVGSTAGVTTGGQVVVINPVTSIASPLTSTNGAAGAGVGFPVAVVPTPIPAGGFGWAQVYGPCLIQTSAATALGTQLNTTATAGAVSATATAGTTSQVGGMTLSAASAGATTAAGYISYPTVLEVN